MRILLVIEGDNISGGHFTAFIQELLLLKEKKTTIAVFSLIEIEIIQRLNVKNYYLFKQKDNNSRFLKVIKNLFLTMDSFNFLNLSFSKRKLYCALKEYMPDIVHFHCSSKLRRPQIFQEVKNAKIPSILTEHGAGSICPTTLLLKGGDLTSKSLCTSPCSVEPIKGFSCLKLKCIKNPLKAFYQVFNFNNYINNSLKYIDLVISPSTELTVLIKKLNETSKIKATQLPYLLSNRHFNRDTNNNHSKTYLLFSGRLVEEKGCQLIIEALSRTDIPLYILGEGPYRNDLEELVSDKKLNNIRFLGWKMGDELEQIYRNAYALVVPSIWLENYPLVIQEAFSYGIPVIGSINGGIPDLVVPDETGLLFERNNVEQLRECIIRLWNDPELTQRLGKNAYDFLHKNNHPDVIYPQLMEIFEKAIEINK